MVLIDVRIAQDTKRIKEIIMNHYDDGYTLLSMVYNSNQDCYVLTFIMGE